MSRAFGLDFLRQDWLGSPNFAFYTLIMVISWSFVPFHSLLYQAGVRQIPVAYSLSPASEGLRGPLTSPPDYATLVRSLDMPLWFPL